MRWIGLLPLIITLTPAPWSNPLCSAESTLLSNFFHSTEPSLVSTLFYSTGPAPWSNPLCSAESTLLSNFFHSTEPSLVSTLFYSTGPAPWSNTLYSTGQAQQVAVLKFSGVVGPVSAQFITEGIRRAEYQNMECFILEMDTPGGLDESMREIIQKIFAAKVPVVVYVYPPGGRAASAGAFILLASHVAAMAPGTNVGAAHPVAMGDQKMDETMQEKVTNDAAAYIKSIAEKRGRNIGWAVEAVRKSISSSETEALKEKVIDLVAPSLNDLLDKLDGRTVMLESGDRILHTRDAQVKFIAMNVRQKILAIITNPNIAYILLLLGIYGLFFELQSPGAIFPGVVGGICLILAFYALHLLPVNYAGLALIILAILMFILEVKVTSHGILAIGGITSMVIGSLLLFESPQPYYHLSLPVIIGAVGITALFFIFIIGFAIRAHLRKPVTGKEGLLVEKGVAKTDLNPQGTILVHGELWNAVSVSGIIKEGEEVVVAKVVGMTLEVTKKS